MHHRPAGQPLSARLLAAADRFRAALSGPARHLAAVSSSVGFGRLAVGLVVTAVMTALVLAVPVVSGARDGATRLALDSSSVATDREEADEPDGESPVVMGIDGLPGTAPDDAARAPESAPATEEPDAAEPPSDVEPLEEAEVAAGESWRGASPRGRSAPGWASRR